LATDQAIGSGEDTSYVRARGKTFGPYTKEELSKHIVAGRIPFAAWLYTQGSWRLLAEHAELRAQHPDFESAPQQPPEVDSASKNLPTELKLAHSSASSGPTTVSAEPVWFVIREKKKFGPFSAADIVGQLQRKQLESTAFVWRPGFATWQKMSQVSEFSKDTMKRLATEGTAIDILVKRKFQRAPYEVEVIAHDNTRVIEGRSMVVGEGGLFLAVSRPTHVVGSRLKLHFREGGSDPFNAVAEVVSVVRGDAPGYCMRFVAIADSDRRRIAKLVTSQRKSK
jgi:hypothetical protein